MPTGLATPSAVEAARRSPAPSSGVGRLASSDSIEVGGFTPGAVIGERYRIIGLLGRGGMGEVYRADDLKLGQPVALKFLPKALSEDPLRLERFYAEVRIARHVSHPNVCRVYDIADLDGQHYLSMEYVDGEDLASLLKRIGHLPNDKALEIARQLCAGLAAAHDKGVLHRDLKPSNVMIDGRGRARITDFGLAVSADEAVAGGEISGTPAYMAPEQLAGKGASVRSDIYALGLVLYEVYTGRKVFEGATLDEIKRKKNEETPTALSEITREVDPIVERIILRCLEKDPRARPASAIQVASALPGGDPLAAALAAGETPSPEMVAASGSVEGLRPAVAWACVAAVAIAAVLTIVLGAQTRLFRRVPLEEPPEVLVKRAGEILKKVGYSEPAAYRAFGFREERDYFRHVREHDKSKTRWDNLESGAMEFWYRQSPREFEPKDFFAGGDVSLEDPPPDISGMATVRLNPRGRLTGLLSVPPQVESPAGPSPPPDWALLFSEAGLDPAKWTPAEPRWTPRTYCDARAAWVGSLPDRPKISMRIEAAAYRGRPVSFELIGPWTRPTRMKPYQPTSRERAGQVVLILLLATLLVGGCLLARRNVRMGRGDRRGATRIALFVLGTGSVSWVFGARHVGTFYEVGLFVRFVTFTLFAAALLWVLYIALEPYVRRRWPGTIVSWSRLLAGGLRDPLVGRDILVGCVLGTVLSLMFSLARLLPTWMGSPPPTPRGFSMRLLLGGRHIVSGTLGMLIGSIFTGLVVLFLIFLLRLLLKNQWAAAAVFLLVMTASDALPSETPLLIAPFLAIAWVLLVLVLMRFGLVAAITAFFVNTVLTAFPITTQTSAWYAGIGLSALVVITAVTLYAFYTSLGGRPVFGGVKLED